MANSTVKISKNVGVYVKPSTSSKKQTTLKKGTKVTVTQKKNDSSGNTWMKCSKGWFMSYKKSSNSTFAKKTGSSSGSGTSTGFSTSNISTSSDTYLKLKKALAASTNEGKALNKTMQLFGLPYQFLKSVDYRVEEISPDIGRKYIENIILDAPVVTIMPGKPSYLPGAKDKQSITSAFLQAASGNLGSLQVLAKNMDIDKLKFYDFKTAYVEYMRYVNVMCRTCAAFLEIQDNVVRYQINNKVVDDFLDYDWKNYRWNGSDYASTIGKVSVAATGSAKKATKSVLSTFAEVGSTVINLFTGEDAKGSNEYKTTSKKSKKKKVKNKKKSKSNKIASKELNLNDNSAGLEGHEDETNTLENLLRNVHYVQFYCDPSSDVNEGIGNTTKESSLKGAFNSIGDTAKDIMFMANSGGLSENHNLNTLGEKFLDSIGEALGTGVGTINSEAGTLVSRLFSTGSNLIKGDNVIMPDIYSNSQYTKDYSITIPLRAMYGNKYSIYMDVLVPLCHILGLVLPKATTANTFASPFLVKVFMPGKFTCNMGIVTSVTLEKNNDSRNVDGLCTEMIATLSITDLYSDLTMTPSNDPLLFINNSSLVEYLAINCGLDLVNSNFTKKMSFIWNTILSSAKDVSDNVISNITEEMDDLIYKMVNITN